ncbi:MAG: alpha/beta fold hydrolase [Acidiferrobacterales bacterium]
MLLHGWPEFWYTWCKNILPLAQHFDVIAPDLRGFGDTEKPDLPVDRGYGLEIMVEDLRALVDELGFERFGIVSHDVGSFITRNFALKYPERIVGLFFFDCPYPGIGRRFLEPDYQAECWYRSFNQLPWAADMVGRSRDSCRLYFSHFLRHWAGTADAFTEEDIDAWVDNFMKPGNLQGGFNWYISYNAIRLRQIREGPPAHPKKIKPPTRMLWGENDIIFKVAWADGIEDYFADIRLDTVPGAGHFMHYEMPDLANAEIVEFFNGLTQR